MNEMKRLIITIITLLMLIINGKAQEIMTNDSVGISVLDTLINLDEVRIVAKKMGAVIHSDKIVFKPDAMGLNQRDMWEMIGSLPGINVKSDGTITINGREGVTVMIDGRKQSLTGDQLATLLRSMMSDNVQAVEVIENPSAEYEANTSGGIISIRRKKVDQKGQQFGLNSYYEKGKKTRWLGSASYNYQGERLALFGNFGYYNKRDFVDLDINRAYTEPATKRSYQKSLRNYKNYGVSGQLNVDLNLSEKSVVGLYGNYVRNKKPEIGVTNTSFLTIDRVDSLAYARSDMEDITKTMTGGAYFSYKENNRRELSVVIDYARNEMDGRNDQISYFRDLAEMEKSDGALWSATESNTTLYAGQVDYWTMIGDDLKVKAGGRVNNTKMNQGVYMERYAEGNWVVDSEMSNELSYDETIGGGYVSGELSLGNLSINGGVRGEYTYIAGTQRGVALGSDSSYCQKYGNFFPSVALRYQFGEKNVTTLGYSKKIKRPGFKQLSPYVTIFDDYLYEMGNPHLKPELIDNFELTHVLNYRIMMKAYYMRGKNMINKSFQQSENGRIYVIPDNVSRGREYGVKVNVGSICPIKWLDLTMYGNFFRREYEYMDNNRTRYNNSNTFIYYLQARFLLGGGFSAQASVDGYTDMAQGEATITGSWRMKATLSKSFAKGKGNLVLYGNDILGTYKEGMNINLGSSPVHTREMKDFTYFGVSLSWTISKGKEIKKDKRPNSQNENKRINL